MNSEIEGWDKIVELAGVDNNPSRAMAEARAAQKLVLGIKNLDAAIMSHQKQTTTRLDKLTDSINNFNQNSGKLYKVGLWLSAAIFLAAVAQVIVAIIEAIELIASGEITKYHYDNKEEKFVVN